MLRFSVVAVLCGLGVVWIWICVYSLVDLVELVWSELPFGFSFSYYDKLDRHGGIALFCCVVGCFGCLF